MQTRAFSIQIELHVSECQSLDLESLTNSSQSDNLDPLEVGVKRERQPESPTSPSGSAKKKSEEVWANTGELNYCQRGGANWNRNSHLLRLRHRRNAAQSGLYERLLYRAEVNYSQDSVHPNLFRESTLQTRLVL